MNGKNSNILFDREAWKSVIFAILIVVLVGGILSWQYKLIEKKSEEKISSIKQTIEQNLAQNVLDKFMEARIEKNENQAIHYLTERAMEQKIKGEFELINDLQSYEILKTEKLEKNKFRFTVKIYEESGWLVEIIILNKILDRYYIDSVQIAG
ncbi:MAG: hypothetical protein QME61_03940 [Patescibacteria group bacterium]|nr:hypothetical protein [Patescibacteria group bacterium]